MVSKKRVKLDADKFMRVVFRIEKPCWVPSHEAVKIIHSDQKHGLKKWKLEDTQDTEYSGLNVFILETYLPVGGTLWFKLAVFDVWLGPVLLHVEEFSRCLQLYGGSRLLNIKYNEEHMKISFMGHPYNVAVPIKNIGIYQPRPGGWNMTDCDLRPELYHRAEYYGVDGTLHCKIIDPPRPKFAEMEKKLGDTDKVKVKSSNDYLQAAQAQANVSPDAEWESDDDDKNGKSLNRKQRKIRKKMRRKKHCAYAEKLENIIMQVGNALLTCYSSSTSTSSNNSTIAKTLWTDGAPSDTSTSFIVNSSNEANKRVRFESKPSSKSDAYQSAMSDICKCSSEENMSAMPDANNSLSVNVNMVTKRNIGKCTSEDDFMGENLTVNKKDNMESTIENADKGRYAKRCLRCAIPLCLAGAIYTYVIYKL